jgi:hypothetical protein
MTLRRTAALIAALVSFAAFAAGQAQASKTQESMVQDDRMLLNYGAGVREGALNDLDSLGVNTLHVDIIWKTLAPSANSAKPPKGKNLADPKTYRYARWADLDSVVRGAQLRGMNVLLTPTAPAPLWGTRCSAKERRKAHIKGICKPRASLYGKFVTALGKRYSGTYTDPRDESRLPLPRLNRWSIYNEPNLKSWLYPATTRSHRKNVPTDARQYRALAYAGIGALQKTGHKRDQILLGETGPVGGGVSAIGPLFFYQALFCINSHGKRLKGRTAKQLGCPKRRIKKLAVTGIAHHTYTRATVGSLTKKPKPGNVTTANISALRRVLKLGARAGAIPGFAASRIYLTEFGVSSRPPAAKRYGVSLSRQAARINLAEYLAYRSGVVRSFTQIGLEDDPLGAGSHPGRLVFQTGLRFTATRSQLLGGVLGRKKRSYNAYRNPLFVVNRGKKVTVWGGVRGVKSGRVKITVGGRTVKTVRLKRGYFSTTLKKRKGSWQAKFGTRKSRKAKPTKI